MVQTQELFGEFPYRFGMGRILFNEEGISSKCFLATHSIKWPSLLAVKSDKWDGHVELIGTTDTIEFRPECLKDSGQIRKHIWRCLCALQVDLAEENEYLVRLTAPLYRPAECIARIAADIPGATAKQIHKKLRQFAPDVKLADVEEVVSSRMRGGECTGAETRFQAAFEAAQTARVSCSWAEPASAINAAWKSLGLKPGAVFAGVLRILLISAAVVGLITHMFSLFLPSVAVPWGNIAFQAAVGIGVFGACCWLSWLAKMKLEEPFRYGLSELGIEQPGPMRSRLSWTKLRGFRVDDEMQMPGFTLLEVYLNKGGRRVYALPDDKLEQIVRDVAKRLPLLDKQPAIAEPDCRLGSSALYALLVLSAGYALGAGWLMGHYMSPGWFIGVVGLILVLGPGTLGCMLLFPRKIWRFRNPHTQLVYAVAFLFNTLGFLLTMMCGAIVMTGVRP